MPRPACTALILALAFGTPGRPAAAAPGADIDEVLRARFDGDRTRACVVAAMVEGAQVRTGRHCPRGGTRVDPTTGFEIGSVTKTMLAALVALRLADGRWSLQDHALRHLPAIEVADPRLATVTVQQLLTHAAGLPALPPTMKVPDAANPYGALTVDELLASLRVVRLAFEPGTRTQYSNFGMLVLSAMLSHGAGQPFTQLAAQELLAPLGMAATGPATATTQGHAPTGQTVPNWTTAPELAGAGFLRSTLDDLVRYARAHLGTSTSATALQQAPQQALQQALVATRRPLALGHGMAWRTPSIGGRMVALHEGATAGFSSVVVIDDQAGRAAVVLADVSLADLGGLGDVALRLIGLDVPPGRPRREVDAPPELQRALVGDYELAGSTLRIRLQGQRLTLQGPVGEAVTLRHDSAGDFFADGLPAVLQVRPVDGRVEGFVWRQGGGVLTAQRRAASSVIELAADALGRYQLQPGFELRVFREDGRTRVQASGQPALDVRVTAPDALAAAAVGLVIRFQRNATGEVSGLVLEQGGQVLEGRRQP
jgi:D-alanyl-D-alanine-carboxypeptidase/D-alanyl-D-alanine-endopeptidase